MSSFLLLYVLLFVDFILMMAHMDNVYQIPAIPQNTLHITSLSAALTFHSALNGVHRSPRDLLVQLCIHITSAVFAYVSAVQLNNPNPDTTMVWKYNLD